MDPLQRLLIEQACLRLVTEYCLVIDHGEAARVADLFTGDGLWVASGITMQGREQLLEGFERRRQRSERMSRHVCQSFLCTVQDENTALGVVYLSL